MALTHEVNVLTIFVDTNEEFWEEGEKEYYYNELMKAQEWLVDQSSNWDKTLEFENEEFFVDQQAVVYLDKVSRGIHPKYTIQKIMVELGYDNIEKFMDYHDFDLENEKLKILLLVKSNNRSHAYNLWSVKDVDLAIVYCRNSFGGVTDRYVMAHELLHQFGAWDLYYEVGKVQTKESSRLAMESYPNSIMLNSSKNKDLKEIDELTAWRIGWSDYKDEFSIFDPKLNKEKILAEGKAFRKSLKNKR